MDFLAGYVYVLCFPCGMNVLPFSRTFPALDIPSEILPLYKAAGVLPFYRKEKKCWMMVGGGGSWKKRRDFFTDFGGKIEDFDNQIPWQTAVREMREENPLLKDYEADLSGSLGCWNRSGKYILFISECPAIRGANEVKSDCMEKSHFVWVDVVDVYLKLKESRKNIVVPAYTAPWDSEDDVIDVKLLPFFSTSLRIPGVEDFLKQQ